MRVLVTGASGYLGSVMARACATEGWDVIALCRSDGSDKHLANKRYEIVRGDLAEPGAWIDAIKDTDAIVHAGFTTPAEGLEKGPANDRATVDAVLRAIAGSNKRFLYTSGSLVLGDTGCAGAPEEQPAAPPPFLAWRADVERDIKAAHDSGAQATIVRLPLLFGGSGSRIINALINSARRMGAALFGGDGYNRWSTIHVEDAARLYIAALRTADTPAIAHASAETIAIRDLAAAIGKAAGGLPARAASVEEAGAALGPFAGALAINSVLDARATGTALGWEPRHGGIVDFLAHNIDTVSPR